MKTKSRLCISLALWLASVCVTAKAEMTVTAKFSVRDAKPDSQLVATYSVEIQVRDENDALIKKAIDGDASSAVDAANWTLEWSQDDKSGSFAVSEVRRHPSSGRMVSELGAAAPSDLGDADPAKDGWRLKIKGVSGKPALTLRAADGSVTVLQMLDVPVAKAGDHTPSMIEHFTPIEPKLTLGGGEDGSILELEFKYRSPMRLNDRNDPRQFHFEFTGTITPNPDEALSLYGRMAGEGGAFWGVEVPKSDWLHGSLLFDLNTRFESDQQADNYNYSFGAGVWGLLSFRPLNSVGKGLHWALNLGQHKLDEAPIFTVYAGYDRIIASEHEAGTVSQDDNRARFRARYRLPVWQDLKLPFVDAAYDVDGIGDFSGVWDFRSGRFAPEWKVEMEFMPRAVADQKLAFVLTYQAGEISPTFADEEAFLAGLRWKF